MLLQLPSRQAGLISVKGQGFSPWKLVAMQNGQHWLLMAVGNPNSWQKNSKSPTILSTMPLLVFLPWAKISKLSARACHRGAQVVVTVACLGTAASMSWLCSTSRLLRGHLMLTTFKLSTSVKGAPSPCKFQGMGSSFSQSKSKKLLSSIPSFLCFFQKAWRVAVSAQMASSLLLLRLEVGRWSMLVPN